MTNDNLKNVVIATALENKIHVDVNTLFIENSPAVEIKFNNKKLDNGELGSKLVPFGFKYEDTGLGLGIIYDPDYSVYRLEEVQKE